MTSTEIFIASETYGYITRKFPYLLTKEGLTIGKCRRDVGYILEAVANDLRVGGNVNSVQAGQAYYTGNNLDFIEGEREETLDAFSYARSLAVAAMRNWEFRIENCSTSLNGDVVTVPAAYTTIGLVEGMSVTASPATGQTDPIPAGTYIKEIISTTQFRLGNANDTDTVNATATITAQGVSGGVTLNFELDQPKFATLQVEHLMLALSSHLIRISLLKKHLSLLSSGTLQLLSPMKPSVSVTSV